MTQPAPHAAPVVAGVDTHTDTHHVAVLALTGAKLGDRQVPATPAGYAELVSFLRSHGTVQTVGVEGTNSYGAGLARHLHQVGETVVEVIRPKRAQRRRGKSDPIDAYAAAAQVLAEPENLPKPKTTNGAAEQIRVLLAVRNTAVKNRAMAQQQIKSLLVTAPDPVRDRYWGLPDTELINRLAASRPGVATDTVSAANGQVLRHLARRHQYLTSEIDALDIDLAVLVEQAAPSLVASVDDT